MRKRIKEFNNYTLDNPFIKGVNIKEIFMKKVHGIYKNIRIKCVAFFPLNQQQKFMWNFNNKMKRNNDNSATNTDDNGEPVFSLEFITVSEVLPKESIEKLHLNLEKMWFKYKSKDGFNRPFQKLNGWDIFENYESYGLLGYFKIKESSKLYKYTNALYFEVYNLSDSFCRLDIRIYPNENKKQELSKLAVSHMDDIIWMPGVEGMKWYQFRYMGEGSKSGSIHKGKIISSVIEDIKWNVLKEINKYVADLLFTSSRESTSSIAVFQTNIHGNGNKEFWRSVGVWNYGCDYLSQYNACISWGEHENPYYIYSLNSQDGKGENFFMADEISHFTNEYLVINNVCKVARNKIRDFAKTYAKIKKTRALKLLREKSKFDEKIFCESRILNEYVYNKDEDFKGLYRMPKAQESTLKRLYKNLNSEIKKTNEFYFNSRTLYENHISYINTTVNYKIQRRVVIFTVISVIVSIISLLVAIISSQSLLSFIVDVLNNIQIIT